MEYLAELLKKKLSEQSDEELNRKWDELDSEYDIIKTDEVVTNEEQRLLLTDLCARLPYGVKYQTYLGDIFTLKDIALSRTSTRYYIDDNAFSLSQIKPYLRPMSSMTIEERQEYGLVLCGELSINQFDWLNEHHFDYRGIIEKGLALEAPEGMYNN